MSVFGKVWGTTGTPVSAYDVRLGVDNGAGVPGTLTSPSTGDVRIGVEYGGDGDQYTGTLVVAPLPVSADDWTGDMAEVFSDSVTEWGDVLVYNGFQISCEKTEFGIRFSMEVSGSNRTADTAIDVLRSDAIGIGLYAPATAQDPAIKRPVVTVDGQLFQVLEFKDDIAADPTIKLLCVRQQ